MPYDGNVNGNGYVADGGYGGGAGYVPTQYYYPYYGGPAQEQQGTVYY